MEKRHLLTTFTVTHPIDGEIGSLRDVISQANNLPGEDTIEFALADRSAIIVERLA